VTHITDYFTEIQQLIGELSGIETEKYDEQVLTEQRGNLRIRLRFADNSLLEISESIQIIGSTLQWISYRYHYQKATGELIFRYDNAPHHPETKTHPEHKHLFDRIVDSPHPDIKTVLNEVRKYLFLYRYL
jgi:hypothetical protein